MVALRSAWSVVRTCLMVGLLWSAVPFGGEAVGQTATGSVTARVFLCPDALSLADVQQATDPRALLATCPPSVTPAAVPHLRASPNGVSQPGAVFAEGVYLWAGLPFGGYDFGGGNAPSGFGGRLVTNGADVPVADQEAAPVTIDGTVPHIERRFYYFAPDGPATGAISLTLYRCPSADELSPAACALLTNPPIAVAGIFQPGWPEANLAGFTNGRASWSGIPLGTYTVGYGGLTGSGEAAAIPALGCVSPSGCDVTIGPAAPVADLALFVYPDALAG